MSEAIKTKAQDTHTTICSAAKNLLANAGDVGDVGSIPHLGQEDPLEEEMATHSTVLAWKIPGTAEPGGLQSMDLPGRLQSMGVTKS